MRIKEPLGPGSKVLEEKDQAQGVGKADRKATSASGAAAEAAASDRVEISSRSREMAKAAEAAAKAPEVRRDKVEDIKRRLENQEYEVEAEKVAHKMIVEFLGEIV